MRYVDPDGKSDYAYYNKDDYNIYCFMNNEISLCKAENLFDFKRDFVKNVVLFDDNGEIVKKIYGKENIQTFFDSLKEPQKWTRDQTEDLCSSLSFGLAITNGICMFVCPAACPFIMGAMFVIDGINLGCKIVDYTEDRNILDLAFASTGVILDACTLGASGNNLIAKNLSKINLFGVKFNQNANRFINGYGRFITFDEGYSWVIVNSYIIPGILNKED